MIYTPMTKKAMKLCYLAHKEQTDKSGLPYVFHPIHLAEQMMTEETTIVALLHDVIEDSNYTVEDLRRWGFSVTTIEAVSLLTYDKSIPYLDYIWDISRNRIATKVKIADLRHNMDTTRLDSITDEDNERIEQYKKAIRILGGKL